jgi:hypothetical protein
VVALEARTEDQRRVVSDALGAALARRPVAGSLGLVRQMVHAAWVHVDLTREGAGGFDMMEVYNLVLGGLRMPLSFV